jgi:hypothetical protein
MAIEEIYLLHHTHVDVGYTDLQPIIYEKHVEYLNLVLDHCRRTDDYPDDARFRWISEFSWPVMRFLQQCPDRAGDLIARLREGRVELCGLYLDPTDLYDRRSLEESLRPALELARQHGFPVSTAMTTDLPGQGWSLADIAVEQGVSYLSVSPNAMVSKPIQVARPFYWIGPRGHRILTWLTDWRKGWYGEGHVLGFPQGFEVARDRVLEYLELLASEGYPWRVLALHLAADNYPPCAELPDLVRTWNEQGDLPRLRIATHPEFFGRLRGWHGDDFPAHRAAWPDWWAEGLGSAAYETALSRETHCRLQRVEALQRRVGDQGDLWPIFEDLLFFDEHTWGCQNMALEPYSFRSRASWAFKSAHVYRAWDAARRVEAELAARLTAEAVPGEAEPEDFRDATLHESGLGAQEIAVFNSADTDYHGPVALPALPGEASTLVSAGQPPVAVQRSLSTELAEPQAWAVLSLGPGEVRTLHATARAPERAEPLVTGSLVMENGFYRLAFDPSGRLLSLTDLEGGAELLDTRAPWGFAEVIHESITGHQDRNAVWERGQTEIPYAKRRTDAPFRREGAREGARLVHVQTGPVFASVTWASSLPFVRRLEVEVRLWRRLKRLDVEVRLDKQPCEAYEGLYVAFPFRLERPRGFIHSCGAAFEAEAEQLPGTCRDYYAVEHFAALADAQRWAVMCPVEAPLVQLGEITFGRWADHLTINRGCLYSWLTNNFWYTNFPGYQQGRLVFRYALTTGAGPLDLASAEAFGRAARVGLVVR